MQVQVKFMLEIVMPHVYKRLDPAVNVNVVLPEDAVLHLSESCEWRPGIREISMGCGKWHGNYGYTVAQISEFSTDLLHVEVLAGIAHAWRNAPPCNSRRWSEYLVIPGLRMIVDHQEYALYIDWDSNNHSVVIGSAPVDEALKRFVIPERLD